MLGDLAGDGWKEHFLENLELHSRDRRPGLGMTLWS